MTPLQVKLEDALCSRVRLRILKLLAESQPFTASEIAAKIGVNYMSARTHARALAMLLQRRQVDHDAS